ncbi:MAG: response regulator transcription factor [Rhodocyclaceae bacterium]|nr:response regulator transcription factor [Rhodocyclaceae bacterium]
MRLLLVEDDPVLGDGLATGLSQAGFTVDWMQDGAQGEAALAAEDFDCMVLDLGLPRLDGLTLLRRARSTGNQVPVLILTARDATADKIAGLDGGADDYLVKPVDLDELAARIRALTRRAHGRATPVLEHGALRLDPAAHRLTRNGEEIPLSSREFAILHHLLANAGRVVTRAQLEQALYGWQTEVDSNAVEVHIHHLRKKLGSEVIRTLRGVGYLVSK